MPAKLFRAYNGASGSIAGTALMSTQSTSATSGAPRTMLQIAPNATTPAIRVIGWGYWFPTSPTNNVTFEVLDTAAVFASGLTAHVAAGIHKMNVPTGEASGVQLGTALTGYATGATTEGTLGATRLLDERPENGLYFYWRFELGREPEIPVGNCLRLRATPSSAAAVALRCWFDWEE
jgi:hypothetical protein